MWITWLQRDIHCVLYALRTLLCQYEVQWFHLLCNSADIEGRLLSAAGMRQQVRVDIYCKRDEFCGTEVGLTLYSRTKTETKSEDALI